MAKHRPGGARVQQYGGRQGVVEFAGLSSHHSAAREVGQDPHLCGPGDAPVLSEVLTDTQLIILSAASQRDDRGVELPANVKGAEREWLQPRYRGSARRVARVIASNTILHPNWRQSWLDAKPAETTTTRRRVRLVRGSCGLLIPNQRAGGTYELLHGDIHDIKEWFSNN
jgi:hypothetical protein